MICIAAGVISSNSLSEFASGIVHGTQPSKHSLPNFKYSVPAKPICGQRSVLGGGPATAPADAVVVPAGSDVGIRLGKAHTTYWFAPGIHTLGANHYAQIVPGSGSAYIGAPGAILDGKHSNYYAFGGTAAHVTISYLTIQNFGTSGGNQNQGVVNHNSAAYWTIDHSTITQNAGAGVMLGTHNTLSYDCLSDNQQYGFNAYSPTAQPAALVLDHNEIVANDTYDWEAKVPGCGCSGGGKFWDVDGAVITNNRIVGNGSVGLWADTNNRGFEIRSNYIADNYSYGIIYEISYNAAIVNNTFVRNGLGGGPQNAGFPTSAIYISESGADSLVASDYNQTFEITGNSFVNNWGGVVLWENANRFCNSPANTSTGACTLDDPSVVNLKSCSPKNIKKLLYFNDCRWKVQNVSVSHNVFDFNPNSLGVKCTPQYNCGFQGIFSQFGTFPSWSPYHGTLVEEHITYGQNNHFSDNTYNGPWQFMAEQQGNVVSWWQWRSDPNGQDKGSTLRAVGF